MANLWQQRWAMIGDSIQAWVLDDLATNPANASNLTAVRISSTYNAATIQNLSCPGATMAGPTGLGNYPDDMTHMFGFFGINGVIITLGTNDLSNGAITIADFQTKYAAYVAAIRSQTPAPIVLVSPLPRSDMTSFPLGKTMAQIRAAVAAVAAGAGANVHYLDGGNFAPVPPAGQTYYNDGLHLNNGGHFLFSDWLYNKIHSLGLW